MVIAASRAVFGHVGPILQSAATRLRDARPGVAILSSSDILHVSDPDMVKDIGHRTPSELGKPNYLKRSCKALFGGGILTVNGDENGPITGRSLLRSSSWRRLRCYCTAAYYHGSQNAEYHYSFIINSLIHICRELIEDATVPLLESWEGILYDAGGSSEIVVDDYLRNLSADVIARA
ncbi:hypothetical protein U9M48_001959 [Paspalum notatum var. saurae]|uniref:Uncharacterized protein n=1 Tax=Paspalum notatum var. saurae TaxID=547442 RepID=A0AAQ3SH36_PASNO